MGSHFFPQQPPGYGIGSFQGQPLVYNRQFNHYPAFHQPTGRQQFFCYPASARPPMQERSDHRSHSFQVRSHPGQEHNQIQKVNEDLDRESNQTSLTKQRISPPTPQKQLVQNCNLQPPSHDTEAPTISLLSEDEDEAVPSGQHPKGDSQHTLNFPATDETGQPHRVRNSCGRTDVQKDTPPRISQLNTSKTDKDNCNHTTTARVNSTEQQQKPFLGSGRASETTWRRLSY